MVADFRYTVDEKRTKKLNLPGVLVITGRGDNKHYYCYIEHDDQIKPLCCPRCGDQTLRNQGSPPPCDPQVGRRSDPFDSDGGKILCGY